MNYRILIVLVSFVLWSNSIIFAQTTGNAPYVEEINRLFDKIIKEKNDKNRILLNDSVYAVLERVLRQSNSFVLPFDSVRYIGKVVASDRAVAVYSWMVPLNEQTIYNAVFQKSDGYFFSMKKISSTEGVVEQQLYYPENWYGALYYDIIPFKVDKQNLYVLLGLRNRQVANQKVIDVLNFYDIEPILGFPVFEKKEYSDRYRKNIKVVRGRVVFEFDNRVAMYLGYNAEKKQLEFDNLSPMEVEDGKVVSYGPDFSVNAYRLKNGKWIFVDDIKVNNKATR